MTPQPSALAALQRYNISGDCVLYLSINGYYFLADDVLAAWPTQAHGIVTKDMAHHALEVFAEYPEDEPGVDAMFAALESVITNPSPSTAALREALTDCVELLESIYKGGPKSWVAERASTLLAGDNRG